MISSVRSRRILLTGATGLVGRYLLRGLLRRGYEVAVLVRSQAAFGAKQRLEEVLQEFETEVLLPRPLVAEGTLSDIRDCSLESKAWLSAGPLTVLHCAASIRFVKDERSGEPYQTNVEGTRSLVEFCKSLELVEFHHVSTAYVGARVGDPVHEKLIESKSIAGNDYEKSKIQAEQIVCSTLAGTPIAIHRPSIVVGDSKTGFTSTFHGFYAPLYIGAQLARAFGYSAGLGKWFREQLGLKASDVKNLVPVDWLSEAILCAMDQSCAKPAPQVLHWTSPQPTNALRMQESITDSIAEHFGEQELRSQNVEGVEDAFREHLKVYESYFSGDPTFNRSNSGQYDRELPCPVLDMETLHHLCHYALDCNFGWPKRKANGSGRPQGDSTAVQIAERLRSLPASSTLENSQSLITMVLSGAFAPETMHFCKQESKWGRVLAAEGSPALQVRMPVQVFTQLLAGNTSIELALQQGHIVIAGNRVCDTLPEIREWIESVQQQLGREIAPSKFN